MANFLGDVNILHGYILAGVLHIDTFNKPIEQCFAADDVVVYVRPHEIAISKTHKENSLKGVISRVHTAGPTVFLEVLHKNHEPIEISVSYAQFGQEQFSVSDEVYFQPLLLNFFVQNELIEFMI